jgi:hypothetical protein
MDQLQKLGSGHSGVQEQSCADSDLPGWLRPRRGTAADPRGSADRSAPADALLSIGHNPTQTENEQVAKLKSPPRRVCKIWKGAARADFPGIPNLNPHVEHNSTHNPPRGKVLTFSRTSRKNLTRQLATILVEYQAYTMALTLPGQFEHLPPRWVKHCFRRLCDQLTAKASRDAIFAMVGFYWKQELQQRGALHFHLLLYGIGPDSPVRAWIIRTWNELICSHPRTAPGDKEKHRWFHARDENFQPVKDMHNYFAKYLGKAETDLIAKEPIPGRWWGVCNRKAIPFATCSELQVPESFAVFCQRITRRILKERINEAHHRNVMRKIGMIDFNGKPLVSRFGFLHLRDKKELQPLIIGEIYPHSHFACLEAHAAKYLADHHRTPEGAPEPLKLGKVKLSKRASYGGSSLLGKHTPSLALTILKFAEKRYREFLVNQPF